MPLLCLNLNTVLTVPGHRIFILILDVHLFHSELGEALFKYAADYEGENQSCTALHAASACLSIARLAEAMDTVKWTRWTGVILSQTTVYLVTSLNWWF